MNLAAVTQTTNPFPSVAPGDKLVAPKEPPVRQAELGTRAWWLIPLGACIAMLVGLLWWRPSYTGDEGFYGVTAENMLRTADYWLRPSYHPLGNFAADRDGFAHPPTNSYLYAAALWLAGGAAAGPDVLNVVNFAALLLLAYRLHSKVDLWAGRCAVLLLAASPMVIRYYGMLEAEPLMTTFGIAAIVAALQMGRRGFGWVLASGLCLGGSFALKLWLCGPLVLAVGAALAVRTVEIADDWDGGSRSPFDGGWLDQVERARKWPAALVPWVVLRAALFVGAFLLPSALHLGAVALVHPEDLGFWLRNIYFGVFTHAGISGAKMAGGATPTPWVHPIWYYAVAFYRDHFFVLPAIWLGLANVWRQGAPYRVRAGVLAAGAFGVVPLSLMKVKEPLYILSSAICLYLLAGMCLAAVIRALATGEKINRMSGVVGRILMASAIIAVPAAYVAGIHREDMGRAFVIAHTVVLVGYWFLLDRGRRFPTVRHWPLLAGGAAVLATFAWATTRVPRDEIIARLITPHLVAGDPRQLMVVASNFKCYQFRTFHRGCYWHDLPLMTPAEVMAEAEYAGVRAFILDPFDGRSPATREWIGWLEHNAVEKTSELDQRLGQPSGFRVWVRDQGTIPSPALSIAQR